MLTLSREQILAHRRRAGALDQRLPAGEASLRRAAHAGLQDSMPRAAQLSIHARVRGAHPEVWQDPTLVQLWGPRYSVFTVAEADRAAFSLGLLPDEVAPRRRAEGLASQLAELLGDRQVGFAVAGDALGINPNRLRYAASTGRVLIRWAGARQAVVRVVPAPDVDPATARLDLARRHLHVQGPSTPGHLSAWSGLGPAASRAAYTGLQPELVEVATPLGRAWALASDEVSLRSPPDPTGDAPVARLLPSGDAYWLLQGDQRTLLVPDPVRRAALWTPRVWPGALLVDGEVAGTWRRAGVTVDVSPWRTLAAEERTAVEEEARALPLPLDGPLRVRWAPG